MSASAGVKIACIQCGREFGIPPSWARRTIKRSCPDCVPLDAARNLKRTMTAIQRECVCGKAFLVQPNVAQKGKGKFCSPACSMKYRRTTVTRTAGGQTSITPKAKDRMAAVDDDKGGAVRCAGPGEEHYRERGVMCRRCEWRAFEVAS